MAHPAKTQKWTHQSVLDIYFNKTDEIERTITNGKGYPLLTRSKDKGCICTVILGFKTISNNRKFVTVYPDDEVFTCYINYRGNLTSLGIQNADKTCFIIIHK
ncbi:MAG TPA: hypothetical protein VFD03_12230 [Clostridia bacterium]|nr:hypothetical protein [Clostridia bacterium]